VIIDSQDGDEWQTPLEMARKVKREWKQRQPVWNDLHYMEGKTNEWQPDWKDFELEKVKNIVVQKIGYLGKYYNSIYESVFVKTSFYFKGWEIIVM